MRSIKLTAQQRKDIHDGKTVNVTTKEGDTIVVTPHLLAWAKAQFAAGQPITVLAEIAGNGMEEVTL
jgi:hypothetical protein